MNIYLGYYIHNTQFRANFKYELISYTVAHHNGTIKSFKFYKKFGVHIVFR